MTAPHTVCPPVYKARALRHGHLPDGRVRRTKRPPTRDTDCRAAEATREPRAPLASIVSLLTISRTVSLSFQSAFHLSLTVLVRYRSLAYI
jgi:hypothetical protein